MTSRAFTSRKPQRHHWAAAALALLYVAAPGAVRAGELETLREENAKLRAENQALRQRLEALEGAPAAPRAEGATAPEASGARVEKVLVPQRGVSVRVSPDAASGATTLATPWYQTTDEGLLPRKEWIQVRARQSPAGQITGAWVLLERDGGTGTVKVESGRFIVDGKVIEVKAEDYVRTMNQRNVGRVTTTIPHEKVRFAIPPAAIGPIARGNAVRFEAGSVNFDLTDEHLAGFAAIDARATAPVSAARSSSNK